VLYTDKFFNNEFSTSVNKKKPTGNHSQNSFLQNLNQQNVGSNGNLNLSNLDYSLMSLANRFSSMNLNPINQFNLINNIGNNQNSQNNQINQINPKNQNTLLDSFTSLNNPDFGSERERNSKDSIGMNINMHQNESNFLNNLN